MSRDAVRLAALESSLEASTRQVRRLLNVLRGVGRKAGDSWCFCGVYLTSVGDHSMPCKLARRELLALRIVDAAPDARMRVEADLRAPVTLFEDGVEADLHDAGIQTMADAYRLGLGDERDVLAQLLGLKPEEVGGRRQ